MTSSRQTLKRKTSEILLTSLTSYRLRRNQSMNVQSWKFGSLDGRKQLHRTDCGVLFLVMAIEIATKKKLYSNHC